MSKGFDALSDSLDESILDAKCRKAGKDMVTAMKSILQANKGEGNMI